MFGKKNKSKSGFSSGCTTLLSKSTEIIGDIHFSGNLEVEGTIRGNVTADGDARVRVMDKGLVEGEISAPNVVINGRVVGDVISSKHIELAANAVIEGNVHYQLIEMVKGAQVNGSLVCIAESGTANGADIAQAIIDEKKKGKPSKKKSNEPNTAADTSVVS